jgi:asparagine synthase (glutamine-hydrolysing)
VIGLDSHKRLNALNKMHVATRYRGTRSVSGAGSDYNYIFNWLQFTGENSINFPGEGKKYTVLLNGYISNYLELCEKYSIILTTGSDIEFLALFFERFDYEKMNELNGFFAIASRNKETGAWYYVTDRYGIKQLYIAHENGYTYVCSELKGIAKVLKSKTINIDAVNSWEYSLGVIPKGTFYNEIQRVKKLPFIVPKKIPISYQEAKIELQRLFDLAMNRNIPNEKFGAYLSGGVDSGMINNWLKRQTSFYSFSMDYTDPEFSEIENIKINAIGIPHHYTALCNTQSKLVFSSIAREYLCDPGAGACYTNFQVAHLASMFCRVVFSGAGGDEFFGGYPHRLNKPVRDIIRRTNYEPITAPELTHFKYDLLYLDAVLRVEDRAAARVTIETRYPLLDNDLVDFALSLPDEFTKNKRILKDISGLDSRVLNGRKRGFSNPTSNDEWVKYISNNYNF